MRIHELYIQNLSDATSLARYFAKGSATGTAEAEEQAKKVLQIRNAAKFIKN